MRTSRRLAGSADHLGDGSRETCPVIDLGTERLPTTGREGIELRLALVLREPPLGLDRALVFEPVERGVKRAFLDAECVIRGVLDPPGDGVAVHRPPGKRL